MANHGVEEIYAAGNIGSIKSTGLANGFCDQSLSGEVHDRIDFVFGKNIFDLGAHGQIGMTENRVFGNGGAMSFLQIVEGKDTDATVEQDFGTDAAYVASRSSDQNVLRSPLRVVGDADEKLTERQSLVSRSD